MRSFDTMIEALDDLRGRGYAHDFNLDAKHLECRALNAAFPPEAWEVAEVYRFEGMNDPGDSAVLYAIETRSGEKGVLVSSYGAYSGELDAETLGKLQMRHS